MVVDVLLIGDDRGPFAPFTGDKRNPILGSLRDRNRPRRRGVDAFADLYPDLGVVCIGILLLVEGLDMPLTVLVGVVDDPSLSRLPETGGPFPFSDRHREFSQLFPMCRIMSQIVRGSIRWGCPERVCGLPNGFAGRRAPAVSPMSTHGVRSHQGMSRGGFDGDANLGARGGCCWNLRGRSTRTLWRSHKSMGL